MDKQFFDIGVAYRKNILTHVDMFYSTAISSATQNTNALVIKTNP